MGICLYFCFCPSPALEHPARTRAQLPSAQPSQLHPSPRCSPWGAGITPHREQPSCAERAKHVLTWSAADRASNWQTSPWKLGCSVENGTRGARRLHAAGLAAGALPSPFQPKFHSGPRGAASPPALHNPQPQAGNAGSPQGSSRRWGCSPGPGLARAPGGRGPGG